MSELDNDEYHGLTNIDPFEWLNIPKPIVEALQAVKEISLDHVSKFKGINNTIISQELIVKESLKLINSDIKEISHSIVKYQEDSGMKMEQLSVGVNAEITKFKSNLITDLDYKQKNNDSKIAYLEEQIFHMKKFTSSLPTMAEIENKIVDACGDLRTKLKAEIKDNMLMPEIRGLAYDIRDLNQ